MISIVGIAVVSSVLFGVVKKFSPEYSILIETGAVVIILFLAYPYLCDIIDFFSEYTGVSGIDSDYLKIVIKSLGIALVIQFSADICRDSGETAMASKVEFAGKILIAAMSLPIAKALIGLAVGMIRS